MRAPFADTGSRPAAPNFATVVEHDVPGSTRVSTTRTNATLPTCLDPCNKHRGASLHESNRRYWTRTSDTQLVDTTRAFSTAYAPLTVFIGRARERLQGAIFDRFRAEAARRTKVRSLAFQALARHCMGRQSSGDRTLAQPRRRPCQDHDVSRLLRVRPLDRPGSGWHAYGHGELPELPEDRVQASEILGTINEPAVRLHRS
jgi:hypothetical protein